MKVSELVGADLDYWVAKASGSLETWLKSSPRPSFTSDWGLAGPIIERERISLQIPAKSLCAAYVLVGGDAVKHCEQQADNVLLAAMRSFVASKLGEDVPAALPGVDSWKL